MQIGISIREFAILLLVWMSLAVVFVGIMPAIIIPNDDWNLGASLLMVLVGGFLWAKSGDSEQRNYVAIVAILHFPLPLLIIYTSDHGHITFTSIIYSLAWASLVGNMALLGGIIFKRVVKRA